MGMLVSANDIADARDVLLGLLATVAYAYSPEQKFRLASGEVLLCEGMVPFPSGRIVAGKG